MWQHRRMKCLSENKTLNALTLLSMFLIISHGHCGSLLLRLPFLVPFTVVLRVPISHWKCFACYMININNINTSIHYATASQWKLKFLRDTSKTFKQGHFWKTVRGFTLTKVTKFKVSCDKHSLQYSSRDLACIDEIDPKIRCFT
jgi:hypothetical protein